MSKPFYGHSGRKYQDAFERIHQFIAENGSSLAATVTTASGRVVEIPVYPASKRNVEISSISGGLELVIHETNLTEVEKTFDGRVKSVGKIRFTLAAYAPAGLAELDAAVVQLSSRYRNEATLETTFATYAAYAAEIGDTTNANISDFAFARTYTLRAGSVEIGGPSLLDIYSIDDLRREIRAAQVQSRVALNTDPSIYADALPASVDPGGTGGWYFSNPGSGGKVNWYFLGVYPGAPGETLLGDLKNLFMTFYPRTTTTRAPFVALYTRPQGDGNDAASWYRSRIVYENLSQSWTANSPVLLHVGSQPSVDQHLPRVELPADSISTVGPQSPDEDVYLAAVGTDSSEAAGGYQFASTKVGYESSIDGLVVTQLVGIGA